ncbi:hypothetical protein ACLOJK_038013 [Asimina triloba]
MGSGGRCRRRQWGPVSEKAAGQGARGGSRRKERRGRGEGERTKRTERTGGGKEDGQRGVAGVEEGSGAGSGRRERRGRGRGGWCRRRQRRTEQATGRGTAGGVTERRGGAGASHVTGGRQQIAWERKTPLRERESLRCVTKASHGRRLGREGRARRGASRISNVEH